MEGRGVVATLGACEALEEEEKDVEKACSEDTTGTYPA